MNYLKEELAYWHLKTFTELEVTLKDGTRYIYRNGFIDIHSFDEYVNIIYSTSNRHAYNNIRDMRFTFDIFNKGAFK